MTANRGLTAEKVRAALELSNYSVTAAAELLGVSRQTVHTWMRDHQIVIDKSLRTPTHSGDLPGDGSAA